VRLGNSMLSNNISKVIEMIPLFDRTGTHSITFLEDAQKVVLTIPQKDRADPNTTYQDRQCGTGLDALVLANQLMIDLEKSIPNEAERLTHIFTKQIFLSDVDPIQVRIARANIKRAVNSNTFEPNTEVCDCFSVKQKTDYTFGSIQFDTTNEFIEHFLNFSKGVVVITKSNKNKYVESKLSSILSYQYLRRVNNTPMCLIHVPAAKKGTAVTFYKGNKKVTIDNPKTVPTEDFYGWQFAQEVLNQGFKGYQSNAGPERPRVLEHSGTIPMLFNPSKAKLSEGIKISKDRENGNIIGVSKKAITENTGYGVEKLIVSKNGNPGQVPNFFWDDGKLACSAQVHWIPMNKKEFEALTSAIRNEPCYNVLFKSVLIKTHTKDFWSKIPNIKYLAKVKQIYDSYYKPNNN
jgi:hypothetical protein